MAILITAATSAQAYRLKSVLNVNDEVLLGDYQPIPEVMLKRGRMIKTPDPKTHTFIHEMLALCLDRGVEKVFALRRDELLPLAEAEQLFAEFGISLFVPPKEIIRGNVPDTVLTGELIVMCNGEIMYGRMPLDTFNFFLSGEIKTGIFIVNTTAHTPFTAD